MTRLERRARRRVVLRGFWRGVRHPRHPLPSLGEERAEIAEEMVRLRRKVVYRQARANFPEASR